MAPGSVRVDPAETARDGLLPAGVALGPGAVVATGHPAPVLAPVGAHLLAVLAFEDGLVPQRDEQVALDLAKVEVAVGL